MSTGRMRRVDEAIRQVLGDAVAGDLKDPRVGFVTVTDVRTSPDLRHARVYVACSESGGQSSAQEARTPSTACAAAHGYLQGRSPRAAPEAHPARSSSSTTHHRPRAARRGADRRDGELMSAGGDARGARARELGWIADPRRTAASCVVAHENPDGDALGSLVAMQGAADRARQGRADVHRAGGPPAARTSTACSTLDRHGRRRRPRTSPSAPTIFLDCGNIDRNSAGALREAAPPAQHRPPPRQHAFGTINHVVRRGLVHRRDRLGPDARPRRPADARRSPRRSTSG